MVEPREFVGLRRTWKSEEFAGLKPTVYDWCRMAAYVDGEGTIDMNTCSAVKPRYIVRVLIGNTNPALPLWCRDTFGGNIKFRHVTANVKAKDCYIWSCYAARAAWILHNCLPWFLLKDAQAQLMMELQGHIDQTKQGRNRTLPLEAWDYRASVKAQLRKLNAKGREAQLPIANIKGVTGE